MAIAMAASQQGTYWFQVFRPLINWENKIYKNKKKINNANGVAMQYRKKAGDLFIVYKIKVDK